MSKPQEQSEAICRFYDGIVAECLSAGTTEGIRSVEDVRVARIVSATERGITLRLDRDVTDTEDGAGTSFAFKFVETPSFPDLTSAVDPAYLRATVENETAVLTKLRAYTRDLLVAGGTTEKRSWVMTRWLAGPSASKEARKLRQKLQDHARGEDASGTDAAREVQRDLLDLIVNVFGTVADLHDLGYTHGDIQPDHLIYDSNHDEGQHTLALIDYGLTRHREAGGIPYRGALVHFAAPEIAAAMRQRSTDITYDVLSEIYSVASVAFFLYTGKTTTQYDNTPSGEPVPFEEKLERIMDPSGMWRRDFTSAGVATFPALEAVLERCLSSDKSSRCPSLRSAQEELRAMNDGT